MQIIPAAQTTIDKAAWNTNYSFVFVHGVAGWGCYDPQYRVLPYWGMFGGNLLSFLSKQGFFCYAASVDPNGSAWDRACELYAQLVGARVDYGKAHATKFGHARFGKDYTGRALVPAFDATHKLNLIGHSFGGTRRGGSRRNGHLPTVHRRQRRLAAQPDNACHTAQRHHGLLRPYRK